MTRLVISWGVLFVRVVWREVQRLAEDELCSRTILVSLLPFRYRYSKSKVGLELEVLMAATA